MMKIEILYHTLTGNSKTLSEEMESAFSNLADEIVLLDILELPSRVDIKHKIDADIVGIVFPVWGGYAARPMQAFLEKLAKFEFSKEKGIFFISSSQKFPCDTAWYEAKKFLSSAKGKWRVLYADNVIMPATQYVKIAPIHLKQDIYKVSEVIEASKARVEVIYKDISECKVVINKGKWYLKWLYFTIRVCEGFLLNHSIKKFVKTLKKRPINPCTLARMCPRGNISCNGGKIKIGKNCIQCLRCTTFSNLYDVEVVETESEESIAK